MKHRRKQGNSWVRPEGNQVDDIYDKLYPGRKPPREDNVRLLALNKYISEHEGKPPENDEDRRWLDEARERVASIHRHMARGGEGLDYMGPSEGSKVMRRPADSSITPKFNPGEGKV